MNPRQLFVIDGAIALVSGLAFTVLPGLMLTILGIGSRDGARLLLASFFGALLIANGIWQLLSRDLAETPAGLAFMRANVPFDTIAIVLLLAGYFGGILDAVAWVFVALFVVVGGLHAWWGFVRPVTATAALGSASE